MTDDAKPRPKVDVSTPNVARMYDYYLGGKDNFAVDREAAEEVYKSVPETPFVARANRAFLGRAVRFLAGEAGIRQFLDIGTGLPTRQNTHEVAQSAAPGTQVVYVDNDPVVLTHARALLATDDRTRVVKGDMRRPEEILADPDLRAHIDLDEPVAVLLVAMLHFVPDSERPQDIVGRLRDAMVPGSYLVLSQVTSEGRPQAGVSGISSTYDRATAPFIFRSRDQIGRFFGGLDLVEPGLVHPHEWRPDSRRTRKDQAGVWMYAGVGRKA